MKKALVLFILLVAIALWAQLGPVPGGGGGSGTVTNIATTSPVTGGPITTTGTIACATCAIGPGSSTTNHLAKFSGTDGVTLADGGAIPTGTVTSVATTSPIAGGTITGTGTITCATCVTSAASLTSNAVVIGGGSQATSTINASTTTTQALFATATAPAFRAIATSDLPVTSALLLRDYCNGTIGTSNATSYFLVGYNTANNLACTSTALFEAVMPVACTAQKLFAVASAAGGAAGSGQVILTKGGTPSALTCTMGTGTSCNDTTHTVSFNAGDTYGVAVKTGQATDTTANPRVSFVCQ